MVNGVTLVTPLTVRRRPGVRCLQCYITRLTKAYPADLTAASVRDV